MTQPVITDEMKFAHMGKHSFTIQAECGECIDVGPDTDCFVCHGEVIYDRQIVVPWDTCKEIYKAMTKTAQENQ